MPERRLVSLSWRLVALVGVALVAACVSVNLYEPPRGHLWSKLSAPGAEPEGYGLYTYVLKGRVQPSVAERERYEALLDAITASTSAAEDLGGDFDRGRYNLFLIPYDGPPTGTGGEGFGLRLSKAVLTTLAARTTDETMREAMDNPGPFLVSTLKPVTGDWDRELTDVFYYDLTGMNPAAMPEIVAAYKRRITRETVSGTEAFQSLRLSLLSIVLDADDHIGVVKVAYADWKRSFGN